MRQRTDKGTRVMRENEEMRKALDGLKKSIMAQYGVNKKISGGDYDESVAVKCVNGTFVGRRKNGVVAYKGIPFVGKPPVGDLRWKAPAEYVPDDGVYEAYYNGNSPPQGISATEGGSLYNQSEDCLYLNVWKADDGKAGKPVMVWIHGGAYEMGGTVDPMYECTEFVEENPEVIVVSIAYRIGVFGFLHISHLPDGKEYPDAQNLGIMDQMMALKWIHENIAAFGGDPDNVTIYGESAGAGSVSLLPLVEGSHAYFKRIIAQSGASALSRSEEQAIACTTAIMAALGCDTVADLQKMPVQALVEAAAVAGMRTAPERDGKYLPLDTVAAYENGAAKDIAVMHGCNKDEMHYFVAGAGIEPYVQWAMGRISEKMAQLETEEEKALVESYCNDVRGEDFEKYSRLLDQIWFNGPLIEQSEAQARGGGKSYTYYFTPESSIPNMRCGHAVELAPLFKHQENTIFSGRAFDETFSKTMRRMWVQFAKTGDPSLSAAESPDGKEKKWPAYDLKDKYVMVFDEFDIHPAKEPEVGIVDWDRTYFLTKYYVL